MKHETSLLPQTVAPSIQTKNNKFDLTKVKIVVLNNHNRLWC